jgi:hypothetical protein
MINSKWIKDFNIRPRTETTTGSSRKYSTTGRNFLNRTSTAEHLKRKNVQLGLYQTKKLLHSKRNGHSHRIGENLRKLFI